MHILDATATLELAKENRTMSQVVLVTGALGDIGWAVAQKFAAHGWNVALNDLPPTEAWTRERAEQVQNSETMRFWPADNADRTAVDTLIADIESTFGSVSVAIVNAAVVEAM